MILTRFFYSIIRFFIYRVGGETRDMRIFALPPTVAPHSITCRACERDPFCVMSVSFRRLQFRAFAIPFTPLKVRRPILLPVILSYYRITLFDDSTRSVRFFNFSILLPEHAIVLFEFSILLLYDFTRILFYLISRLSNYYITLFFYDSIMFILLLLFHLFTLFFYYIIMVP